MSICTFHSPHNCNQFGAPQHFKSLLTFLSGTFTTCLLRAARTHYSSPTRMFLYCSIHLISSNQVQDFGLQYQSALICHLMVIIKDAVAFHLKLFVSILDWTKFQKLVSCLQNSMLSEKLMSPLWVQYIKHDQSPWTDPQTSLPLYPTMMATQNRDIQIMRGKHGTATLLVTVNMNKTLRTLSQTKGFRFLR